MGAVPSCPHKQILTLYHQLCPGFSPITKLTRERKKTLDSLWQEHQGDMGFFHNLFTRAQASDYLKGTNQRKWKATFDWILSERNIPRILEGNYDHLLEKPSTPTPSQPPRTGFHLPESRGKNYTNDQLEALLLKRKAIGGPCHEPAPETHPGG